MKKLFFVLIGVVCAISTFAATREDIKIDSLSLTVTANEKIMLEGAKWLHSFKLENYERNFGDCSLFRDCHGQFAIVSPACVHGYLIYNSNIEEVCLPYLQFDTDDWTEISLCEFKKNNMGYIYASDKKHNLFVIIYKK